MKIKTCYNNGYSACPAGHAPYPKLVHHLTNEQTFRNNINIYSFHFLQKCGKGENGEPCKS